MLKKDNSKTQKPEEQKLDKNAGVSSLRPDAPEYEEITEDLETHTSPTVETKPLVDISTPVSEEKENIVKEGIAPVTKEIHTDTTAQNSKVSVHNSLNWKVLAPILLIILILGGYSIYGMFFKKGNVFSPVIKEGSSESSGATVPTGNNGDMFENPVNGRLVPVSEAANFKDKKPIAIMVNNYVIARPSAGLSYADVVYEAVAEGGITRLMPIFFSQAPEKVTSVRSARYYFVDLAAGYKAHYIHWGAAHVPPCQKLSEDDAGYCSPVNGKVETEPDVDAYDEIVKLGVPNLDGGNYDNGDVFGRDPDRVKRLPIEHTAYVKFDGIYDLAKKIRPEANWHKYQPIGEWKFKDDAPLSERGDIGLKTPITYNWWDTMEGFNVKWEYDKENNEYIRYQGDVKQTDELNGKDLRAKTVVVRFTKQDLVGDKKNHLYHEIVGTGDVLVFEDGKVIKGTWKRDYKDERDVYTDLDGNPIEFVRGQIWIQLVPKGNDVEYWKVQDNTAPK